MSMFSRTSGSGRSRRTLRVMTSLALVGSLTLAACGDDDSSSDGGTDDTTADSAAPAPTGDPLVVWVVSTVDSSVQSYPNIEAAAEIYEQYINDNGGIGGRPLDMTFCDGKTDPNEDAACARQAVEAGAIALVGGYDTDVSLLIEVLEESNTAWFGACCPVVAKEFSSPIAFNMGSVFSFNAGAAYKMSEDGCEAPAFLFGENGSQDYFIGQTKAAFEKLGYTNEVKYLTFPLTTSDYSALAAKAASGTDCIHGFMGDIQWLGFIPAMKAVGGTQRLYGPQGNLNEKVGEAFPAETEGGVSINAYPNIAGPMWDDYRAALEKYDAPDLDWNSLAGLGTWAAFEGFRKIVEQMIADGLEVNNNTFIDAANATSNLPMDNMVGDLDFTSPWTGEGGAFPRIFNRSVAYDIFSGGKLSPMDDKTYDMTPYHAD